MTRLARRREPGGPVIGARRPVVLGLVTRVALSGGAPVHVVRVARTAGGREVTPSQDEETVVIEGRRPRRRGSAMARLAGDREAGRGVIGAGRPFVVRPVTPEAVAGRALVDVAPVAGRAGLARVYAGQRKVGRVLERRLPEGCVRRLVAQLALRREPGGLVRRLFGGLVLPRVARKAGWTARVETPIHVATVASERAMRHAERHARRGTVVPGHRRPTGGTMACFAVRTETGPIRVVLTPDPVTAVAGRRRALDGPFHVTLCARDAQVPAVQIEPARLVERARGVRPAPGRVARGAGGSVRAAMRVLVAGTARRRERQERTRRVAGRAGLRDGGMTALKGKPRLGGVVELGGIDRPQLGVDTAVLHVAATAGTLGVAVHSSFQADPIGDRLVTGQARFRQHLLVGGVAGAAVVGTVEERVGPRQRPRRHLLAGLRRCGAGQDQRRSEYEQRQTDQPVCRRSRLSGCAGIAHAGRNGTNGDSCADRRRAWGHGRLVSPGGAYAESATRAPVFLMTGTAGNPGRSARRITPAPRESVTERAGLTPASDSFYTPVQVFLHRPDRC